MKRPLRTPLCSLLLALGFTGVWLGRHGSLREVIGQAMQYPGLIPAQIQGSNPTGFDVANHLTHQDLAAQAELILIGKCISTMTIWVNRNLYTLATISVSETLKGDQSSTVTVALPGGVDANRKVPVAMTYPGAPHIASNEDVFLFLMRADDQVGGTYTVVGFSQGKFSIAQDHQGNAVVSQGLAGLRLETEDSSVQDAAATLPLAAFKEEIKSYIVWR
jgi:hypothetical protein